ERWQGVNDRDIFRVLIADVCYDNGVGKGIVDADAAGRVGLDDNQIREGIQINQSIVLYGRNFSGGVGNRYGIQEVVQSFQLRIEGFGRDHDGNGLADIQNDVFPSNGA